MNRPLILTLVGCSMHPAISTALAQERDTKRLSFGPDYTTEFQTDFSDARWVNLLELQGQFQLGAGFAVQAKTISVATAGSDRLIDDLQIFSNIEEQPITLAPSVLGFEWQDTDHGITLFAGVRNVGEDYFVEDCTSLFTNSSCGIYPTISGCYDIATYPFASLGVHFVKEWSAWHLQASVYNGRAYNRFAGRENVFRFCPATDGVFGIASIKYDDSYGTFVLGTVMHSGYHSREDMRNSSVASPTHRTAQFAPWVSGEWCIGTSMHLLTQASVNLSSDVECKHYQALGMVFDVSGTQAGLIANHASFADAHEYALELTWQIPLTTSLYIQPAAHLIRTGDRNQAVGLMRFGISI